MTQGSDDAAPRRLRLNRETLRDLAPSAARAADVRGGTISNPLLCQTTLVTKVPPVDPTDATTTGITIGGCRPGKFKIEHRIRTEYEVFEDNSVVIRGFNTHETEPEELEDFRDLDG